MSVFAHMFAAVLLANSIPHLIHGFSGAPFHSPFAKPAFRGLSSPAINILWGGFNFFSGCALLFGVGSFQVALSPDTALVFGAGLFAALGISRSVEKLRRLANAEEPAS